MAQPSPYVPATAFVSYESTQSWFPGSNLDTEFNNLDTIIGEIETNLAIMQSSTGALTNGIVTYQSLSPTLQTAGLSPLSVWATGTAYAVPQAIIDGTSLYQCVIAHTSGVFATDLAAGNWILLCNLGAAAVLPYDTNFVYNVPITGFSLTLSAWHTVLDPAGVLATGTLMMPALPSNGQLCDFRTSQTITSLTVAANSGQSVVGAPTTLVAGSPKSAIYRTANKTWYF